MKNGSDQTTMFSKMKKIEDLLIIHRYENLKSGEKYIFISYRFKT